MSFWLRVLLCLVCLALPNVAGAAPAHRMVRYGSQTHLPLPRFASIRAPMANLRRGPGLRYPIKWVYRRRHLPVLILREFDNWRLLLLPDGTHGWMDRVLLTPHRTFIVTARYAMLRGSPRATAEVRARLARGVVGMLDRCRDTARWCGVSTHGIFGFVRRTQIWGTDYDALHYRNG